MERTGDWFAERPLGIEGDAGQISDRGEPECFRPARKPPSAEDSYCGGEPNSALLLGPRIGQRLGEARDREICRRGPGAARSAEPLRRFERVGEVRCYSRLNMGRHQVERIERKPARPRWGWSGVHKIVPPLWAEAALGSVAVLLPSRQSSIEKIVAKLLVIGSRYHRNLHQDEFGPTRAERMQALRDLLDRLEVLSSRLEALPPQLRLPLRSALAKKPLVD